MPHYICDIKQQLNVYVFLFYLQLVIQKDGPSHDLLSTYINLKVLFAKAFPSTFSSSWFQRPSASWFSRTALLQFFESWWVSRFCISPRFRVALSTWSGLSLLAWRQVVWRTAPLLWFAWLFCMEWSLSLPCQGGLLRLWQSFAWCWRRRRSLWYGRWFRRSCGRSSGPCTSMGNKEQHELCRGLQSTYISLLTRSTFEACCKCSPIYWSANQWRPSPGIDRCTSIQRFHRSKETLPALGPWRYRWRSTSNSRHQCRQSKPCWKHIWLGPRWSRTCRFVSCSKE